MEWNAGKEFVKRQLELEGMSEVVWKSSTVETSWDLKIDPSENSELWRIKSMN